MTKEELHRFAADGVRNKIAAMEVELSTYHREWPELFLSATAPVLLKAELKHGSNGNGSGPWVPVTIIKTTRHAASWTPERRAAAAARMRGAGGRAVAVGTLGRTGEQAAEKRNVRAHTARLLAQLAGKGPLSTDDISALVGQKVAFGTLTNNGYLRKVGKKKYQRTSKPFVVETRVSVLQPRRRLRQQSTRRFRFSRGGVLCGGRAQRRLKTATFLRDARATRPAGRHGGARPDGDEIWPWAP